jgi:CubicO group peptidase (beta-lactamase class C family)
MPAQGAPASVGAQSTLDELGRWIDQAVVGNNSCIGLAVGAKKDQVAVARFFGTTGNNGQPNLDTEFEIGSITKTFTTALLAWSHQKGRMRIDDPLSKYAPVGVPTYQGQPILVVQLADHTSGLPRQMPISASRIVPQDVWEFLGRYQLTRAPGEEYVYSNVGVNILGLALERTHDASLDQLFARVITGPLGMHDTAIVLSPQQHARLAWGFGENGQRATEFVPGYPFVGGAGGLRSTLRDMMRYLDFQIGGAGTPLDALLPILHEVRHAKSARAGVGLAWNIEVGRNETPIIFHSGLMPGYSSMMIFGPTIRAGVVVLANQANCGAGKVGAAVFRRLNGTEGEATEPMPQED